MDNRSGRESSLLIGSSRSIHELREQIRLLAFSAASVLITGESGVGKDLVARALHAFGERKSGAFIAVNCSALSPGILESELFGHGRGAFTGAVRNHAGFFEQARGGTLFLDEIGEMPLGMQAKLLRVLHNRKVRRMGEAMLRSVDFRLISATNADLDARVASGRFRRDLYYRINVVEIKISPLRERPEDIDDLVSHFYRCRGMPVPCISSAAEDSLRRYSWPGNVRELENEVERLAALYGLHDAVTADMLSAKFHNHDGRAKFLDVKMLYDAPLAKAVGVLEQDILKRTLSRTNWNKSETARKLGLSRQGLLKKIKRYGITPEPFIIDGADSSDKRD